MADEPKVPRAAGPSEEAAKPRAKDGSATAEPATPDPAAVQPAVPGAGPAPVATKPGTSAAKPAPPPAKPVVKAEPWSSPLLEELQKRFPGAISDAVIFRNQPSIVVAIDSLSAVCEFLRGDQGGGYTFLTDQTAVDYPKREKRFEIVYHLYSFKRNDRLRLKVMAGEGEKVPSVVAVWPGANWLEREVFDMFGVQYEGHPSLKRILLPDEWMGHPLRKDYDILKQDEAWVQKNLEIESGQ